MQDNKKNEPQKPKKRAIILNFGNQVFQNFFANALLYFALNTALVFALIGYTKNWIIVDSPLTTLYFIVIFTTFEIIVRYFVHKWIPNIMLYSFGSIGMLITVLSMFTADQLLQSFSFRNATSLSLFIIILIITRFIFYTILLRKKISNILDKQSNNKNK
jgi:hypothetical protein